MTNEIDDLYSDRYNNEFFNSLWVEALGSEYPVEIQPYSSCTNSLLLDWFKKVKLDENSVVADFGCGTGGLALWLSRQFGCKVVGIDMSEHGIKIAKQRAQEWGLESRVIFQNSSFENSELLSDRFNLVVSIDALPFAEDIEFAFKEIYRVLSPKGKLLFTARELKQGSQKELQYGLRLEKALSRSKFISIESKIRPEVSTLWRKVYDQWSKHEGKLRSELCESTVDRLMNEVQVIGPLLEEDRDWLSISADKCNV